MNLFPYNNSNYIFLKYQVLNPKLSEFYIEILFHILEIKFIMYL